MTPLYFFDDMISLIWWTDLVICSNWCYISGAHDSVLIGVSSNPAVVTWMLWVVHLNKAIYLHCLRPNLRNNKENVLQIQKKIYFIIHIYMYLFLATNSLLYWLKKKITKNIKCVLWISWLFHQHDHTQTEFFPILTWPLIYSLSTADITCNLLWLFDGVKQVGMLEACSIVCIFRGKPKNHKSHLLNTQVKDMFPLYTNIKIRFSKMISC